MDLDRFMPSPSAATRAAHEVAAHYHTPSLLEHCERAYLWGATHAVRSGIAFDRELLYVAAMLHDLGLCVAFDNVTEAFEIAGGDVAWVFTAGAGWAPERRRRTSDIIVRHMWDEVPTPDHDPESHLLSLATSFDISGGSDPELWPDDVRDAVLAAHPRLELVAEFTAAFTSQARRKPGCTAAAAMDAGLAARIAANPLDR